MRTVIWYDLAWLYPLFSSSMNKKFEWLSRDVTRIILSWNYLSMKGIYEYDLYDYAETH